MREPLETETYRKFVISSSAGKRKNQPKICDYKHNIKIDSLLHNYGFVFYTLSFVEKKFDVYLSLHKLGLFVGGSSRVISYTVILFSHCCPFVLLSCSSGLYHNIMRDYAHGQQNTKKTQKMAIVYG